MDNKKLKPWSIPCHGQSHVNILRMSKRHLDNKQALTQAKALTMVNTMSTSHQVPSIIIETTNYTSPNAASESPQNNLKSSHIGLKRSPNNSLKRNLDKRLKHTHAGLNVAQSRFKTQPRRLKIQLKQCFKRNPNDGLNVSTPA